MNKETVHSYNCSCSYAAVPPHCFKLPDVAHAQVSTHNTDVGTEVTFTCDTGFTIFGSSVVTCMANGRWSSPTPFCFRTSCTIAVEVTIIHSIFGFVFFEALVFTSFNLSPQAITPLGARKNIHPDNT